MTQASDLEFNGPFPDWWNVVDDFGADPTGTNDSTTAFQAMIDAMTVHLTVKDGIYVPFTGYIPSGTYLINTTLYFPDPTSGGSGAGVNLWGQDPETTILKWNGGGGFTMLWSDGCNESVVARLTFDGQNTAGGGFRIEHNLDLPTSNSRSRVQDCIFKNLNYGFWNSIELPGEGTDSEFSVMRCKFYSCNPYGIYVQKPEAYNYWVRQCYFEDCATGIANGPSGAFNVYDCVFVRSTEVDIQVNDGMRFCGIRRNYSFDSKRFLYASGTCLIVQDNHVSNSVEVDTIQLANRVKVMILNNKIKSADEATTGPVINCLDNVFGIDANAGLAPTFVLRNQFTVSDPIYLVLATPVNNDIEGNIFNPGLVIDEPDLPPFPPQIIRPTFIIIPAVEPQETVNAAAAYANEHLGSNPVLYLPYWDDIGLQRLSQTLVFPSNTKMSLQAAGTRTAFGWDPATRETSPDPYMLFRGPSKMTLQNIGLGGSYFGGGKRGIQAVFDNVDQVGGRIYADNCWGGWSVIGSDNVKVDLCDFITDAAGPDILPQIFSGTSEGIGGGRVLLEGGAGSGGDFQPMINIQNGGRFYLRDYWYETNGTDQVWATLSGMGGRKGQLTIESSQIEQHNSPEKWAMKAIEASDWWGNVFYINDLILGTTNLAGDASRINYLSLGGGSPLLTGSQTPATMYRQDGVPFGLFPLTMETFESNSGFGIFGKKPKKWWDQLYDTIERVPTIWIDILPDGVTDVRFHRAGGDAIFMSDEYQLIGPTYPSDQTTDFSTGIMPPDAQLTRASEGTRIDETGLMIFEPEDVARFTYDPVTHALRGLLVEPSRTNYIWASENTSLGWPIWPTFFATVDIAAGVVAPDGGTNGNQRTEGLNVDPEGHFSYQGPNYQPPGETFSVSAYMQHSDRQYGCITALGVDADHWFAVIYDTVGVALGEALNATPADDTLNPYILDAGGGWCRCILSGAFADAIPNNGALEFGAAPLLTGNSFNNGELIYIGDGTSRFNVWGIQAEIGELSSYIRSTSTTEFAVRAVDILRLLRPNGTYSLLMTREDGIETVTGQVVTDGTLVVPPSVSPLISVKTTRTA